jgi:hypothetical protein
MMRLRQTLLIALALIAIGSVRAQARPTITFLDPGGVPRTSGPGASDSGEPDIGQQKNSYTGQTVVSVPVRLANAVRWVRVVWGARYLGIGF